MQLRRRIVTESRERPPWWRKPYSARGGRKNRPNALGVLTIRMALRDLGPPLNDYILSFLPPLDVSSCEAVCWYCTTETTAEKHNTI